jgi:hypothetical protein
MILCGGATEIGIASTAYAARTSTSTSSSFAMPLCHAGSMSITSSSTTSSPGSRACARLMT